MSHRSRRALRAASLRSSLNLAPVGVACLSLSMLTAQQVFAQSVQSAASIADPVESTDAATLPPVVVTDTAPRSVAQQNQLPNTTAGITATQAAETVNVMNTEDLTKYLPSVLVRKRFIGDTQAPIATRTTGINASARSLIVADGVWLSTLIGNNNGSASPRWFMVAPEEVERVDVLYGPFAAEYPGNSYGAVVALATRMPQQFEASVKVGFASQNFDLYGTHDRYNSTEASATLGSRSGDWSWWLSLNRLDSHSQPISFGTVTPTTPRAGSVAVSGGYADFNRTGAPIAVVGAGSITHTVQDTAKLKLGYDLPGNVTAAYTLGYWHNQADASAQTYLSAGGAPYYGAGSGYAVINGSTYGASSIANTFASSATEQDHVMQSVSLKRRNAGEWGWEAVASDYRYVNDSTRTSTGFSSSAPNLYPGAQTGGTGRIADMQGTGWSTFDAKGIWKPQGANGQSGANTLSFGFHQDRYALHNPTYNTADWLSGDGGALYASSAGTTHTLALWAQDVWRMQPDWMLTLGARQERWQASGGQNINTTGATDQNPGTAYVVNQPEVQASGLSPKASLSWVASDMWRVTGSVGRALRFPTVGELYQNVQTGSAYTQPNPYLKPEDVLSSELAIERFTDDGDWRVSVFDERVKDALISQTSFLNGSTPVSFTQNVDRTHQKGVELAGNQRNIVWRGFDLGGSLTYVDGRIAANNGYVPTTPGATSVGKRTPYIPDWRATFTATWRPSDSWSWTLAGRYSGRMYATVDNTDVNSGTYTGFQSFFVMDLRGHYRIDAHWEAGFGIDNLNNCRYWLYHPFPQRTVVADLRWHF